MAKKSVSLKSIQTRLYALEVASSVLTRFSPHTDTKAVQNSIVSVLSDIVNDLKKAA